jgi:hypothetical protein
MMSIRDKHIEMVEAVNAAQTIRQHRDSELLLEGWREGVRATGIHLDLLAADSHYLDAGINRPMCCGVWLDWTPAT